MVLTGLAAIISDYKAEFHEKLFTIQLNVLPLWGSSVLRLSPSIPPLNRGVYNPAKNGLHILPDNQAYAKLFAVTKPIS